MKLLGLVLRLQIAIAIVVPGVAATDDPSGERPTVLADQSGTSGSGGDTDDTPWD